MLLTRLTGFKAHTAFIRTPCACTRRSFVSCRCVSSAGSHGPSSAWHSQPSVARQWCAAAALPVIAPVFYAPFIQAAPPQRTPGTVILVALLFSMLSVPVARHELAHSGSVLRHTPLFED